MHHALANPFTNSAHVAIHAAGPAAPSSLHESRHADAGEAAGTIRRFVLDERAFFEAIEPPPLVLQR